MARELTAMPGWMRALPVVMLALALVACGKKGAPLPPEPRGPLPVAAVGVRQVGGTVEIRFEVAGPRGPRPNQEPILAEVLRVSAPEGLAGPADPSAFRRIGKQIGTLEGDPLPYRTPLVVADRALETLPESGAGLTLRYAVRLRDRRGRASPLVVSTGLSPLPPAAAPRGLEAEPTADGIRLTWQPPAEGQEAKFNLYRGDPGEPVLGAPLNPQPLAETAYLDTGAETGARYAYTVRVVLADGRPFREGHSSAPFVLLAEDQFAPAQPKGLIAIQEGPAVRLFWDPNSERDLAGYRLYRRVDGGEWTRIGPDPVEQPLYLDRAVSPGQILAYRVTAVDRTAPPNEGPPSDPRELALVAEPGNSGEGQP